MKDSFAFYVNNAEQAGLLLELLSKAAVSGANAKHLAALYERAISADEYFKEKSHGP